MRWEAVWASLLYLRIPRTMRKHTQRMQTSARPTSWILSRVIFVRELLECCDLCFWMCCSRRTCFRKSSTTWKPVAWDRNLRLYSQVRSVVCFPFDVVTEQVNHTLVMSTNMLWHLTNRRFIIIITPLDVWASTRLEDTRTLKWNTLAYERIFQKIEFVCYPRALGLKPVQ